MKDGYGNGKLKEKAQHREVESLDIWTCREADDQKKKKRWKRKEGEYQMETVEKVEDEYQVEEEEEEEKVEEEEVQKKEDEEEKKK